MVPVQLHRAGDRGVLAEFAPDVAADLLFSGTRALRARYGPSAVVTGHSSALLLFDSAPDFSLGPLTLDVEPSWVDAANEHTIAVSFAEPDAPDLDDVLAQLSIGRERFIDVLTNSSLRVRFTGFLPGFAYLDGLPAAWNIPRRATSRTRVPAGSLGIAAGMAGFYPSDSPGGWNIVGRALTPFWDPQRTPPALLSSGDVVHITRNEGLREERSEPAQNDDRGLPVATCLNAGQQTLIATLPDIRRYEDSLPASGVFDAAVAIRANAAVGNEPAAFVLECALVGPELHFERECRVAWEGATVAWEKNGVRLAGNVVALSRGDVLRVGRLTGGLRGWLAISGGLAANAPRYATRPLRLNKGNMLYSNTQHQSSDSHYAQIRELQRGDHHHIEVVTGPHRIDPADLATLLAAEWTVTPSLDRTGVRLRREGRDTTAPASIPSCGMQVGTVQLHPNGDLVVMGPDHPITGGYVQPFTVASSDIWKLAQLQPGDVVRWRALSAES